MIPRILIVCILLWSCAVADIKAKTRVTASGATVETTTLVKGPRVRQEPVAAGEDPQIVRIYQCDLRRLLLVNPKNKTYRVVGLEYLSEAVDPSAPTRPARSSRSGKAVTLTTVVTDTGERRELNGRPARGVDTETAAEAQDSCSSARKIRLRTRGWYADLPGIEASCAEPNLAGLRLRPAEPECSDRLTFRMKGALPQGLPLLIESTLGTSEGEVSMKQELAGITEVEGLEAALFDAPAGYRLVQTQEELLASDDKAARPEPEAAVARPERATRSGAARPELTRVCVAPPTGLESSNAQGAQLRLISFLNRQGLQPVTIAAEEKPAACRYSVAVAGKLTEKPPRLTYRVTEVAKPGKPKSGSVMVKAGETEDQLWENAAKAIASHISKQP